LHAAERAAIEGAVPARRQQFATGRALLRQLLGRDLPIGVAPDRRPLLPAGTVASLAHDDEIAVALVSTAPHITGLGVDVERLAAIGEVAGDIVRPDDAVTDALEAFVVKEAVYKAWSRPGGPILDHHDVRTMATEGGSLVATVLATDEHVPVAVTLAAGRWLAVAVCYRLDG
jgi:4'-phosphopantetheinyl transferase EntD